MGKKHLPSPTNMEEKTKKGQGGDKCQQGRHANPLLQSRPGGAQGQAPAAKSGWQASAAPLLAAC